MTKKVLFCSEASWYSTGYSVYTKEVLSRLNQVDQIEVAELACYASKEDSKISSVPWKVYPNKPPSNDPSLSLYNSHPSYQFGEFSFNHVLLDFQPDIVIDIRDWWMFEYQQRSAYRDFFHWAIMPTVDATPQDTQWINTFSSADAVFAYSEFGRDVMLSQSDSINFIDIASPAASDSFSKVDDKKEHKTSMGISPDATIIGTVMRNQKRKLYPDLFESFRNILNETNNNNLYLYCHTFYPDVGWDIPRLLNMYNLSNRVLFTYKCKSCKNMSPDFFQDAIKICKKCGKMSDSLVGISNSIDESELAKVYNLFDVYVQYANSEGFGMPQLEAAHCGLPVISTYYSAMESVIDNIGGFGIYPKAFYVECETGCKRAIPDNLGFKTFMKQFLSEDMSAHGERIRENALKHYSWDKTADVWRKHIESVETVDPSKTWLSPPKIFQPSSEIPNSQNMIENVNFIFKNILHKPEWIGNYLWKRVLRDCTFGYRCENINKDFYFNESHVKSFGSNKPFSLTDACKEMSNFRSQINQWEELRKNKLGI